MIISSTLATPSSEEKAKSTSWKFLDFPLHRLIDCNWLAHSHKKRGEHSLVSSEWVKFLNKLVLLKAFQVLWVYGINQYSSIGSFFRLCLGKRKALLKNNAQEACKIIMASLKEEIERIDPTFLDDYFEVSSKLWDGEILLESSTPRNERTLWSTYFWWKYGHIFRDLYRKHKNPINIKWRIRALKKELEWGWGYVSYRWKWREANWEKSRSILRILEYMYLLENDLFEWDDKPWYC